MPQGNPKNLPGLKLLTDQALCEAGAEREDGLEFDAYATILTKASLGTPGPFTIGVFGEWGTGKTSLMRLIQKRLDVSDVVTVWFNAWQYEKEEHPIIPLVGTIVQEIERNKKFTDRLSDGGAGLLRSLRAIVYGFSAKAKVRVPGFAEVEAGFVAKDIIEREEKLTPDPLIERSLYYRAFDTLSKVTLPRNARVIVLIDDLDRCFPDKAIRLLESIKLVLSQRGFIFIIGVARRVIEGYLDHRYQKRYGLTHFEGGAYLDKIVQLAFPIPPHAKRMEELADSLIAGLDEAHRNNLAQIVPLIAKFLGGNPRSLVRFINNLLIDEEISRLTLKQDVPIEFFAISRCLELRWRPFYEAVVLDHSAAEFSVDATEEDLLRESEQSHSPYANIAKLLLVSPGLSKLVETDPCSRWLKDHDTRERAVFFLRSTFRNVDIEIESIARDDLVVTLVTSSDPNTADSLYKAFRDVESEFSEGLKTYQIEADADKIYSKTQEYQNRFQILIVYTGEKDIGELLREQVHNLGTSGQFIIIPFPTDTNDFKTTARSLLRRFYGVSRHSPSSLKD